MIVGAVSRPVGARSWARVKRWTPNGEDDPVRDRVIGGIVWVCAATQVSRARLTQKAVTWYTSSASKRGHRLPHLFLQYLRQSVRQLLYGVRLGQPVGQTLRS